MLGDYVTGHVTGNMIIDEIVSHVNRVILW